MHVCTRRHAQEIPKASYILITEERRERRGEGRRETGRGRESERAHESPQVSIYSVACSHSGVLYNNKNEEPTWCECTAINLIPTLNTVLGEKTKSLKTIPCMPVYMKIFIQRKLHTILFRDIYISSTVLKQASK